jgi:hypothetical protein
LGWYSALKVKRTLQVLKNGNLTKPLFQTTGVCFTEHFVAIKLYLGATSI